MNLFQKIEKHRFFGILRGAAPEDVLPCAEAFANAGGVLLEITFNPSDPGTGKTIADAVEKVRRAFPELCVGCGTVLTSELVEAAADAGAEYIVSPHTSAEVVAATARRGLLSIAGAYTPTEICAAWRCGADLVKIFPVLPGEERYVKTVMSPLSHIPFLVTGGVTPDTIEAMLSTGALALGAGASIFAPALVAGKKWRAIEELAKLHLERVNG